MTNQNPPIIALLVGEVSGDNLAASLIRRVKQHNPSVRFIGVGGEKMIAEGFESLIDMEHLSVMGADVIRQLPKLLALRSCFIKQLLSFQPDLLIGIDAPDFNFTVERKLKAKGIPAWHWVSPSVWAWRRRRIKKIAKCCDEIMCLFPQEPALYNNHPIKASFYGHPMADEIPLDTSSLKQQAYQTLIHRYPMISDWRSKKLLALLPGSRFGEVKYMLPLYLEVARHLSQQDDQLRFIVPIAKQSLSRYFREKYEELDDTIQQKIVLIDGEARQCMSLADIVLLASGTAALEAMLLKKPMVVAHQGPKLNYLIFKYFVYTPYVSLPNFMEDGFLIEELLFDDANRDNIIHSLRGLMDDKKKLIHQIERFTYHHQQLKQDATNKISAKIIQYLQG